jgi:magnesium transporter
MRSSAVDLDDQPGDDRAPSDGGEVPPARARLFDADGADRVVEVDPSKLARPGERQLLWVDIDRSMVEGLAAVTDLLELDADDLERIRADSGRALMTRRNDRFYLTLEELQAAESDEWVTRREIDLIATHGVVATIHDGQSASVDRFLRGIDGETSIGVLRAADLMSALIDEVIDGYFEIVELIEHDIDELDQTALAALHDRDVLEKMVATRARIAFVRRTLAPHRQVIGVLDRPDLLTEETIGAPWPGLGDRLEAAIDAVESLREQLLGTYDIHMGRTAQRANDVMKALTLLSGVILPAVVLAGVMGMNFKLPFFDDPTNFFVVVAAMVIFGAILLGTARWRNWI